MSLSYTDKQKIQNKYSRLPDAKLIAVLRKGPAVTNLEALKIAKDEAASRGGDVKEQAERLYFSYIEPEREGSETKAIAAARPELRQEYERASQADRRFGTLRGYSNLVAGIGWVVVILGVVLAVVGVGVADTLGPTGVVAGVAAGIVIVVMGIGLVASGQVITCFVAIEENTRATYDLLQRRSKGDGLA